MPRAADAPDMTKGAIPPAREVDAPAAKPPAARAADVSQTSPIATVQP